MRSERFWTVIAWVVGCVLAVASASRLVPVWRAQFAAPFDPQSPKARTLCTVQAIQTWLQHL